jgi:hypothetical protein
VLEVTPGHKLEDAQRVLSSLSAEQRSGVRAIAMDMWPAYMSAACSSSASSISRLPTFDPTEINEEPQK